MASYVFYIYRVVCLYVPCFHACEMLQCLRRFHVKTSTSHRPQQSHPLMVASPFKGTPGMVALSTAPDG